MTGREDLFASLLREPLCDDRFRARLLRQALSNDEIAQYVEAVEVERVKAADALDRLRDGIHAAVSFTYIDGEAARIRARVALKEAAGWPLTDGEVERLATLESE